MKTLRYLFAIAAAMVVGAVASAQTNLQRNNSTNEINVGFSVGGTSGRNTITWKTGSTGVFSAGSNLTVNGTFNGTPTGGTLDLSAVTVIGVSGGLSDGDKGDITVGGSGTTLTVDDGAITLAKMASMATASLLGRNTGGTGAPEALPAATARSLLGLGGAALLNIGTGSGTVAAGDDSRFTDTRTPTDGTVTTAKVQAATLVTAAEGIGSNNNDTTIPTSAAVKAYADSVVGGGGMGGNYTVTGNVVSSSGNITIESASGQNIILTPGAGGYIIMGTVNATTVNAGNITGATGDLQLFVGNNTTGNFTRGNLVEGTGIDITKGATDVTITSTAASNIIVGNTTVTTNSTGNLTLIAGDNITLTANNTNKSITINATAAPPTLNAQTGTTYTLVLGDANNIITMSNAAANTLTVPLNASVAFPTGSVIAIGQMGAGLTTVSPTGGVTLNGAASDIALSGQYQWASLVKLATDTWSLSYSTTPSGGGDFSSNTASSVDSEFVLFSGTGGKTGKRATGTGIARSASGVFSASELSGDVTTSGSNVAAIAADAVTYAKMQNISAQYRVLGRISSGAGDPEELTPANVLTHLESGGTNVLVSTEIDTNAELRAITVGLGAAVVNGTFASPTITDPLTLTANDLYGFVLFYGATGTVNLPAGVAGMNGVIYNTGAFTITIDPNGSEIVVRDGTAQTGGVSFTLSSGAGNYVAIMFDGTRWVTLGYKGTLAVGS